MAPISIPSLDSILRSLKSQQDSPLTAYEGILRESFAAVDPVFTRDGYVDFFWHCALTVPGWIPSVVLANAEAESDGSKKLVRLWQSSSSGAKIDEEILFHARDEMRHSHVFVKTARLAFPAAISADSSHRTMGRLNKIRPEDLVKRSDLIGDDELLDHLIQMNMGEIRTLIHMHFLGPVIFELTPECNKERVARIIRGLANDELVHIGYTSEIIEDWCESGDRSKARTLYERRLSDFHRFTISQTEDSVSMYGAGRFPTLLDV